MIAVERYDIEAERREFDYGCRRERLAPSAYRIRLEMVADHEGLEAFLAAMERIGCGIGRPSVEPERRPLPETTRALPPGPIDGEFIDDDDGGT